MAAVLASRAAAFQLPAGSESFRNDKVQSLPESSSQAGVLKLCPASRLGLLPLSKANWQCL